MKKTTKIILGGITVAILGIAVFMAPNIARMPIPQAERIEDGNLVGIDAGGSFAWIIPTENGVVLVDAGWSADAAEILAEIGDRKVMAILLTHGHFDHTSGFAAFPDTTVYVGPGEEALVMREIEPKSGMTRLITKILNPPIPDLKTVIEFVDGKELLIDGIKIRAIHTPGHTGGSAMYIWNDTLFSGDAIVGRGDRVNEPPRATFDDYDQSRLSVAKVLDYSFDRLADGHVGLHKGIRTQVEDFVNDG